MSNTIPTTPAAIGADASTEQCTIGVGNGAGSMFVHGDYEAIKRVQEIIFENERLRATLASAAQPAAPAAVAEPMAWPVMPPSKGQSPVLFEDGYAEGWAKCLEACRAALAAAPAPAAQGDALVALIEHYGRVEFQRYRVGPDESSTHWDIELGHYDLTVSGATLPAAIDAAIAAVNPTQGE